MLLNQFEFPDGFRAAAELRGFNFGQGRQPLSPSQRVDETALAEVLRCILADFGLVDPPAAGCAPRTGQAQPDKINQIVAEVVKELGRRGVL